MQETRWTSDSRRILSRGPMQLAPFKWAAYRINLHMLPQEYMALWEYEYSIRPRHFQANLLVSAPKQTHRLRAKELVGEQHKVLRKAISSCGAFHPDCEMIAAMGRESTPFPWVCLSWARDEPSPCKVCWNPKNCRVSQVTDHCLSRKIAMKMASCWWPIKYSMEWQCGVESYPMAALRVQMDHVSWPSY